MQGPHAFYPGVAVWVMLVYASGQCVEQRSCSVHSCGTLRCLEGGGVLLATAEINTLVPADLVLVSRPRRRFACRDLARDYPGV